MLLPKLWHSCSTSTGASEAYELQILPVYFLGTRCEIDRHRYSPKICPAEAELQVARKTAEPSRDASCADGRGAYVSAAPCK